MDFSQLESYNLLLISFNCRFASWKSNTPTVLKNPKASDYYKYITWFWGSMGSNASGGKNITDYRYIENESHNFSQWMRQTIENLKNHKNICHRLNNGGYGPGKKEGVICKIVSPVEFILETK